MLQSIIIDQFIAQQDPQALTHAYAKFTAHFHNPVIQANIKQAKEEQYQEGFLKDLFGNVFGYTLNPQPHYNLTTELKNLKGAKKCDGAILKDGNAVAVIELKGMDTTDLGRIEAQAFGYKNHHPTCRYVITANFQKLRFYIDNAVEFLEFDLFKLTQAEFNLVYLLLNADNLLADIPLKIKSDSISQEAKITKALYQDYSAFKRALFEDLKQRNPDIDELTLFQKSQKLLDRLLFIFFAEDSRLLPPNLAHTLLGEWEQAKKLKLKVALYDHLKNYFGYLDVGYKDEHSEIFAYNGGLFKPDDLLDRVLISDEALAPHIKKLADYDFASEVDVNILGHIFENSLSEIDEIKAEIKGEVLEKSQTKRKKDGVFYTPKYITSYIVANTVGKLCADKKAEFGIVDSNYITDKKRQRKTQEALLQCLKDYRAWLLNITICDPACGNGAFLNEALNFLMTEHRYLDELESKLFGGGLVFQEVRNHILEHNLFGVDINPESVEIARLSLWLRTAEPHRKLSNLNENVKCGNSLIDEVSVAGERAFVWADEFPSVFKGQNGGFDVVIGNPPYVRSRNSRFEHEKQYFMTAYKTIHEKPNLYLLFIEKSLGLVNKNGMISFIIPNSWLGMESAYKVRQYILENYSLDIVLNLLYEVFEDVGVESSIFVISPKKDVKLSQYTSIYNFEEFEKSLTTIDSKQWLENRFSIIDTTSKENELGIIVKLQSLPKLQEFFDVRVGLQAYEKGKGTPIQTADDVKNHIYDYTYKFDESTYRYLEGKDIERYSQTWSGSWLKWGKCLSQPKDFKQFERERILVREITGIFPNVIKSTLINEVFLNNKSIINILELNENYKILFLLPILNSRLIGFYHIRQSVKGNRSLFPKAVIKDVKNFPFIDCTTDEQKPFIAKAEEMLRLNQELQTLQSKFKRTLEREFNLQKPTKKLQDWHNLTYTDFIKELTKQKIALTLTQKSEWEDYFATEQHKAQTLQTQIQQTDQQIDHMVYQLYGLTDDDIAIIEAN